MEEGQGVAVQSSLQCRRQCLLRASLRGGPGGAKDSANTREWADLNLLMKLAHCVMTVWTMLHNLTAALLLIVACCMIEHNDYCMHCTTLYD